MKISSLFNARNGALALSLLMAAGCTTRQAINQACLQTERTQLGIGTLNLGHIDRGARVNDNCSEARGLAALTGDLNIDTPNGRTVAATAVRRLNEAPDELRAFFRSHMVGRPASQAILPYIERLRIEGNNTAAAPSGSAVTLVIVPEGSGPTAPTP